MKTQHKVSLNEYWGDVTIVSEKKEDLKAFLTFLSCVLMDAAELAESQKLLHTSEHLLKIREQIKQQRDE